MSDKKFYIFKNYSEFNKSCVGKYDILKFLINKSEFSQQELCEIYNKVDKKNLFFNNSFETKRYICLDYKLDNNEENKHIKCTKLLSLTRFLRDELGIITTTLKRSKYWSSSNRFDNIEKYLNVVSVCPKQFRILSSDPELISCDNSYSYCVDNIDFIYNKKEDPKKLEKCIGFLKNNQSVFKKSDFNFLKNQDYCYGYLTIDINPLFLTSKQEYLKFSNNECSFKNDVLVYYIKNNDIDDNKIQSLVSNIKDQYKISPKWNHRISFENFISLVNTCKKIYTNSFDLLCLAIIFNKQIDYLLKDSDNYQEITDVLNIKWNDGMIQNYNEVLQNIENEKKKSFEHLKLLIYRDIFTNDYNDDSITLLNDYNYIEKFKEEYYERFNNGIIIQRDNTKKNKEIIKNISYIQVFYGTSTDHINASKKAIELFFSTQLYLPEEHIFIELQTKKEDLQFEYLKKYGVKYYSIIYKDPDVLNLILRLYLFEYAILKSNCENLLLMDSDCTFVNEDAFLNIEKTFLDNDIIIPFMWVYKQNDNLSTAKILPSVFLRKKENLSYSHPGFSIGFKRKIYDSIKFKNKIIHSPSAGEDILISEFLTGVHLYKYQGDIFFNKDSLINNIPGISKKFSYSSGNILIHLWHNYHITKEYNSMQDLSLIYNIYYYKDENGNLKIKDNINYRLYCNIIREKRKRQNKFKISKYLENDYTRSTHLRDMFQYIYPDDRKIQNKLLFNIYGKSCVKLYIVNSSNDLKYLKYLKKIWEKSLENIKDIKIYTSNFYVSNFSIIDIFDIEKEDPVIITNEYCLPLNTFSISNIMNNTLCQSIQNINNSDIFYFRGDFSYITKSYQDKISNNFRDFMFKFQNVNNLINAELYKNNVNYEYIQKYISINNDRKYCPDILTISKKYYWESKEELINLGLDYDVNC